MKAMNGDLLFRILFLVLFLLGVSIRGYYARKVRATRKRRSIKERLEDTVQTEGKGGHFVDCSRHMFDYHGAAISALFAQSILVSPSYTGLVAVAWCRLRGLISALSRLG